MKVDLTLLVPSWVLQYDTWREFLEVLEQSVNEIASNVDDLRELYDIEKAKEFIVLLARNFGFKELSYEDVEKNVQLLDNQVGFVQWKGSEEFFKWLLQLFEITVVFRDLSKEVLVWSGGRGWDRHVIEDARYYRDGSIEVTVPVTQFWRMKELERFVSAGVYVWYHIIAALQMLGMESRIRVAEVDVGMSLVESAESIFESMYMADKCYAWSIESCIRAETSGYYLIVNPHVESRIEVVEVGVGVSLVESVRSVFGCMYMADECYVGSVESHMGAKVNDYYLVVNPYVVTIY